MAKVKIQGNASGTGVFTITPPATSTDRTLTLPDSAGTLVNTAPSTSGNVLTSDGTNWTSAAAAAGGVDGIVSSADATAITIDSSENVGIGTGVPISELSIGSTSVSSYPTYSNPGSGVNQSFFASNLNSGDSYNARLDIVSVAGNTDATNGGGSISFYTQPKVTPFAPIERLQLTRDGRGLSQFTAKAWVNFSGTGTPTIRTNHNVSSITDVSTGTYVVNFTNALGSADYAGAGATASDTKVIVLGANST